MVDRAFLGVAEDEAAAERAFVALPSADLFSPIIASDLVNEKRS
ncbi:hypothetical protein X737_37210 [Mesorhizobium sp. L48C026A00]|nr:hypothetical protein X737_37210 [Mesorhizobium sp. L48C026A00]